MRSSEIKQAPVQTASPGAVNPSEVNALLKLLKEMRSIEKEHWEEKARAEAASEQARIDALAKANSERAKSTYAGYLRIAGLYLFVKHKEKEIELDTERKKLEMQRLFRMQEARPQTLSQAIQTDEARIADSKPVAAEVVAGGDKEKASLPQPSIVAEPVKTPAKADHGVTPNLTPSRITADLTTSHVRSLAI